MGLKSLLFFATFASASAITRLDYGTKILNDLGAPTCQNNMMVMVGWAQAENDGCACNMLSSTEDYSGATTCGGNPSGVKNYPNSDTGAAAIVKNLNDLPQYYSSIVSNLKNCADPSTTGSAIANSPWGTGALAEQCIEEVKTVTGKLAQWGAVDVNGCPSSVAAGKEQEGSLSGLWGAIVNSLPFKLGGESLRKSKE